MKPHIKSGIKKGVIFCIFILLFVNIVVKALDIMGVQQPILGICGVAMFLIMVFYDIIRKQVVIDKLEANK